MSAMKKREHGFSLLELLAVMSIMGLLTTLAVTSYFSAARGMARRGAVKHLVNSLALARQRACMDNARVSVFIYNEFRGIVDDGNGGTEDAVMPSYVVCKEVGKITTVDGNNNYLVDEFNALDTVYETVPLESGDNYTGGFRLYNLSQRGFTFVYPWVFNVATDCLSGRKSPYTGSAHNINAWAFKKNDNSKIDDLAVNEWEVGDSYGIEAAPSQTLPKGFQIEYIGDDKDKSMVVTFLPDGRAVIKDLDNGAITIEETRMPLAETEIFVNSEGQIKYDGEWQ